MFIEKELGKTFDEIYHMYILFDLSNRKVSAACRPLRADFTNIIISQKIANFESVTRVSPWFCRCWWNFVSELVCRHFLGFSQMLYFGRQCRITLNSPKCCRFPPNIGIFGPRKCKRKSNHVNDDSKSHTERLVVHPKYIPNTHSLKPSDDQI